MFAALSSRGGTSGTPTRRTRFGQTSVTSDASDGAVFLDTDEQERVVRSLERQASKSAKTWRAVFGITSILFGLFFAKLARGISTSTAETLDVAWSQPVHLRLYDGKPNDAVALRKLFYLDALTSVALVGSGVTMNVPHRKRFGGESMRLVAYVSCFVFGALAAVGWFEGLKKVAPLESIFSGTYAKSVWIPAVSFFGPVVAACVDASLEHTVRETRALRRMMYRHKRA
jgi:hypothetical protein